MTDTNAIAACRWIAERLLWERFLDDAHRDTVVVEAAPAEAAAA